MIDAKKKTHKRDIISGKLISSNQEEEGKKYKWFFRGEVGKYIKVKCLTEEHIDVQLGDIYDARILEVGPHKIKMLAVIDDDNEEFFYDFKDF